MSSQPPLNHCAMSILHSPPLLTWKGMQLWSVGSRAPGLCKFFIKTKTPAKVRIARFFKRQGGTESFGVIRRSDPARKEEPTPNSTLAGCCFVNCVEVAKNADGGDFVIEACSAYERVKVKDDTEGAEHIVKLGSATQPDLRSQGSSRSSSASQSDSSTSSSKLMGSPAALSSKLKGTCTRIVSAAQQNGPRINELFVGNQFLTHVTAAPVVAGGKVELNPSAGLVNGPQKPRDADIKDRIMFFQ